MLLDRLTDAEPSLCRSLIFMAKNLEIAYNFFEKIGLSRKPDNKWLVEMVLNLCKSTSSARIC